MRLKYSGFLVFFTCLIISCGIVQAKDKVIFIQTEASITFTISENLAGSVASKLGSGIYIYKLSMPEFVASVNKNFVTKNVEGVQKVLSIHSDESELLENLLSIHAEELGLLLLAELDLPRQAGENLSLLRFSSSPPKADVSRKQISHPLHKKYKRGSIKW